MNLTHHLKNYLDCLQRFDGYLIGKRDSGKTTWLKNIAKYYLDQGKTVLFSVQNPSFLKGMSMNNPNLHVVEHNKPFKNTHADVLLVDEIQLVDTDYYKAVLRPCIFATKGKTYATEGEATKE